MQSLRVFTADSAGKHWPVLDATGITFTTKENGFDSCNFTLSRAFGVAWEDIALNMQVLVYNNRFDVAWHGRLESITPTWQNGKSNVKIVAAGYWYSAFDLTVSGTVTGTTPEACIKTLMTTSYLLQLSTTQTGIATTGVTGYNFTTGNGGTDDIRVGDAILAICKQGDSSNNRVFPYVLDTLGADGKPLLNTKALNAASPTARYVVRRANVASISLSRSLSMVKNRIIVRYKDSTTGALNRSTQNDTSSQGNLGIDFTGSAGTTNFIRSEVLDISGLQGGTTSTIANNTANARLNETKRVRNVASQAINLVQDYVVFDTTEGQEIPLWKVRAGYHIQIPDLLPRVSEAGTGTSAGDYALATTFYITQTSYNAQTGALSITPEQSSAASEVMSR